jgi:hypothetical protein
MRTWTIRLAAIVALAVVGLAMAQQPAKPDPKPAPASAKPDPNSLEAMLATALKTNPDIQVAEAKLREAEAGLNKARVQVLQQLVTAKNAVDSQKTAVVVAESTLKRTAELHRTGIVAGSGDLLKGEALLAQAKADLVKAEADLGILLGKIPGQSTGWKVDLVEWTHVGDVKNLAFTPDGHQLWALDTSGAVRLWDAKTGRLLGEPVKPAVGSMDARIREALTKPVKIENWKEPLPVGDVIEYLKKKAGADVPFRLLAENPQTQRIPRTVDLMAGELPLSAWLAVIEDSVDGLVFVVREYGILITTRDRMPSDGVRVREFLRHTEPKKDEAKKP